MALRIGINGFGRIGRNVLRAGWDREDLEFVFINDLTSDQMLAYLLEHDSVHGRWKHVEAVEGGLSIDGTVVQTSNERDPAKLPWKDVGVDVVLECTGVFRDGERAGAHIRAGAPKVILSAPGKNIDATFVYGVNHEDYDPASHHIVSCASCTTNCLAPLSMVLHQTVGIEKGLMTTVHGYTMDQNLLDGPHPGGKIRRARAAALNIVPTSTGAAKAIALVLPELSGKLNGMALRVPVPDGSLVDLTFTASRPTSAEEINAALSAAAEGPLVGVLEATWTPVVSSDIVGNPHSSIADLALTDVSEDGSLVKVLSWYDNEWGFSNRMLDLARVVAG